MAKKKMTLEEKLEEAIVSDMSYEMPENWIGAQFGKIMTIEGGTQPPKSKFVYEELQGYIRLYQIRDFSSDDYKTFVEKTGKLRIMNEEDIMLARYGASIGKIFMGKSGAYNVALARLIYPETLLVKKYLYWYLKSDLFQNNILGMSRTAVAGFNKNDLETFFIPIPNVHEQQRIVGKIESLFEKLDKAKELIQEARDEFENRKAAILDKAFRGELIDIKEDDNTILIKPNIEFEMMHSKRGFATFKDIILSKPRNGYSPKAIDYETSVRTLKLGAITKGTFDSSQYKYIDEEIPDDSHLWLKKGDFLIQRANSIEYVGTSAIYNGEDDKFIYPDLIMKFNVNKKLYNDKLLWYWINSIYGKYYFTTNATGTTGNMPKINQKILLNLPIPIFSLAEQVKIVEVLDKLLNAEIKAQKLISQQNQIELIKKSILAKAFRGELGTNNPEEESAIELLKEILSGK
ncbi:MAG: restriction endonuclease subunit S [Sarcina sp.]